MIIGDKEIAMMFVLHLDEVLQSAEIISEVKVSGRPDATDNCFHGAKIVKLVFGRQLAVGSRQLTITFPVYRLPFLSVTTTTYIPSG